MPEFRIDVVATVGQSYIVTATDAEDAEVVLAEMTSEQRESAATDRYDYSEEVEAVEDLAEVIATVLVHLNFDVTARGDRLAEIERAALALLPEEMHGLIADVDVIAVRKKDSSPCPAEPMEEA